MTATIDERVTSLENRMDEQERLRAGQDRDLSDIAENVRAQGRLIQALAVTQTEHTQTLAAHTQTLAEHTQTLAEHTQTLAEHTQTLAEHTEKLDRLETSVGRLESGMHLIDGKLDLLIEQNGVR